ncbi:MAG: patatin-like phospholipase family protein [Clostridia bacterium]|nr:patatin-like phospholipase family protein [Clostridia bacterium]
MAKKKKLGFALGSGGARGVAHIGFLQAMEENGIKPDYISGCSMGSVVGAAYACGLSPAQMFQAVKELKLIDLIDLTTKPGGLFDTRKMRKVLAKYLGEVNIEDLTIPYSCIAVDMVSQQVVEFKKGNLVDAVVCSSSIPSVFKPTEKDGMRLVDGGILERVPVREVKDLGAKKIVAVDVMGNKQCQEKCPGIIGMMSDVIELMDNHRTRRRRAEIEHIIDLWCEPDLGTMSAYTFRHTTFAYQKGYECGLAHVEQIKALLQ